MTEDTMRQQAEAVAARMANRMGYTPDEVRSYKRGLLKAAEMAEEEADKQRWKGNMFASTALTQLAACLRAAAKKE
jgi:hypothetical protein